VDTRNGLLFEEFLRYAAERGFQPSQPPAFQPAPQYPPAFQAYQPWPPPYAPPTPQPPPTEYTPELVGLRRELAAAQNEKKRLERMLAEAGARDVAKDVQIGFLAGVEIARFVASSIHPGTVYGVPSTELERLADIVEKRPEVPGYQQLAQGFRDRARQHRSADAAADEFESLKEAAAEGALLRAGGGIGMPVTPAQCKAQEAAVAAVMQRPRAVGLGEQYANGAGAPPSTTLAENETSVDAMKAGAVAVVEETFVEATVDLEFGGAAGGEEGLEFRAVKMRAIRDALAIARHKVKADSRPFARVEILHADGMLAFDETDDGVLGLRSFGLSVGTHSEQVVKSDGSLYLRGEYAITRAIVPIDLETDAIAVKFDVAGEGAATIRVSITVRASLG